MTRSLPGRRRGRARRTSWSRRILALFGLLSLLGLAAGVALWSWSHRAGELGERVRLRIAEGMSRRELRDALIAAKLVDDPQLLELYLALTRAASKLRPGEHLLRRGWSVRSMLASLTRRSGRPTVKLTIVEGHNRFQVAERLQSLDVAWSDAFLAASVDPALLGSLGLEAPSAEGYLFPATYDLYVDSDPARVLGTFVREALRRWRKILDRHPEALAQHTASKGWDQHELVVLASIIEKEAADTTEHGLIASVFHNRMNDATFRPRQMLQSDPTAGYGCLLDRERIESCREYAGLVTSSMLRDATNPYNTYKHPGLPPGPISNPSASAFEAALAPPETPYFFFVAGASKRHAFSRTLSEHESNIVRSPGSSPSEASSRARSARHEQSTPSE